jgi:hypothetical protein
MAFFLKSRAERGNPIAAKNFGVRNELAMIGSVEKGIDPLCAKPRIRDSEKSLFLRVSVPL